jgi:DNA-binding NtrC family response regulator
MKAVALSSAERTTCDMLPEPIRRRPREPADDARPIAQHSLREIEWPHVLRALESTGRHPGHACAILGVSRPRLRRMIRQFGLRAPPGAPEKDPAVYDDPAGNTTIEDSP